MRLSRNILSKIVIFPVSLSIFFRLRMSHFTKSSFLKFLGNRLTLKYKKCYFLEKKGSSRWLLTISVYIFDCLSAPTFSLINIAFNSHMHKTFLQLYCMIWVSKYPPKEMLNLLDKIIFLSHKSNSCTV